MRTRSSLATLVILTVALASSACKSDTGDESATTDGTGDSGTSSGSGDGDGDSQGDGDGDSNADTEPACPLGSFDCPCDDGMCDAGLSCGPDNVCRLGGDDAGTDGPPPTTSTTTTGETATTGGSTNPYAPDDCEDPGEILGVEGVDGEFCATPCLEDADCPDGPPDTDAACAISTDGVAPEFCTLICKTDVDGCPEGSTCKSIPNQPGFGLCTFP